jgi:hypothetical protein
VNFSFPQAVDCRVLNFLKLTLLVQCLFALQIQRSLQLRIEEQGKCLQMMLEQQCIPGTDKAVDASTSAEGTKPSSDLPESSAVKDVPENSQNGIAKQTESGDR